MVVVWPLAIAIQLKHSAKTACVESMCVYSCDLFIYICSKHYSIQGNYKYDRTQSVRENKINFTGCITYMYTPQINFTGCIIHMYTPPYFHFPTAKCPGLDDAMRHCTSSTLSLYVEAHCASDLRRSILIPPALHDVHQRFFVTGV